MEWAAPTATDTILDVGVNTTEYSPSDNYLERHYPYPQNVTALGLDGDFAAFQKRYPAVRTVTGDGTAMPFSENEFSIAYSNAVIEHVGAVDKQIAFVREMYRVSRRGYVTTPNKNFPVEPHTRVPLLHLVLTKKDFDRFLTKVGKAWATGDYMHLLTERDFCSILEGAGIRTFHVFRNRLAGMPMSFTATWTK